VQWAGVLLAPLAFLAHLEINYALVPSACAAGNLLPVRLASLGTIGVAIIGCAFAYRDWTYAGKGWSAEGRDPVSRFRFMSIWGFFMSLLFICAIAAQMLPTFFLDPCK
jgi:hypothetical protein